MYMFCCWSCLSCLSDIKQLHLVDQELNNRPHFYMLLLIKTELFSLVDVRNVILFYCSILGYFVQIIMICSLICCNMYRLFSVELRCDHVSNENYFFHRKKQMKYTLVSVVCE